MKKFKILVVDDELDIQRLIVELLSDEGYQVEAVDNGEDALKKVKEFSPHLVVLDWQLPDMEGVDVLRIIKSEESTMHIPVIMCTSLGSQDNKIKGLETGADDYVTKPFSSGELLARVKVALRRVQQEEKIVEATIAQLQRFLPKEMLGKFLSGPKLAEGERRIVTVLFADLTGFTSMAEQMDPEEVKKIVNECFKGLVDVITMYGGTIDKFIGDAIMALFGAPSTHCDDPQRALKAAIVMLYKLKEFNNSHPSLPKKLQMRIGINTGEVVAGTMGGETKMEYTVIGDTVNTASRLQSVAQPDQIVLSENTYNYTKDEFIFEKLAPVSVKGKKELLNVYALNGAKFQRYNFIKINDRITPYVLPEREYNFIKNFVDKITASNTGYIVTLIGEHGVGKSRLLFELSKYIENLRLRYYEFRCLPYGVTQGGTIVIYSPQENKFINTAVKQVLINHLESSPVVVLLDDLHYASKTIIDFLNSIVDLCTSKPLLIVATTLPGIDILWKNNTLYREITLPEEIRKAEYAKRMIDNIFFKGDERIAELKAIIFEKSENVPYFIESIVEYLLYEGTIVFNTEGVKCNKIPENIDIPPRLWMSIMAQVDQLDTKTKEVLQISSVIGKEFKYKILKQLVNDENLVKEAINKLLSKKFVLEKSLLPERIYAFKYNFFYEVVYNSLLISTREELQKKIVQLSK
ncbi:MAG: response regulator [Endomicrobia bacterium]|nr:response regulator [Endomicrobiia bacterium]